MKYHFYAVLDARYSSCLFTRLEAASWWAFSFLGTKLFRIYRMSKMNANALEQYVICVGYKNFKISSNQRTYPMTSILSIIYVYLGYIDRKVMILHQ